MKKFLISSLVALATTMSMTSVAFAHAHLRASLPSSGSHVAISPKQLVLRFSEGLNVHFTGIQLKGPQHVSVMTEHSKLKKGNDRVLIIGLEHPLKAGRYQVRWHALSKDGHKTHGHYSFTVK